MFTSIFASTMKLTAKSYLEFFSYFIAVQSALMDKRYRLTPKEQVFLAECAAYHCQGGNLHDFEEMADYLISRKIVSSYQECSVYKNRLSIKKWIDTGRGRFRLPASLSKAADYDLNIRLDRSVDPGNDRQVPKSPGRGAGIPADGRRFVRDLERGTDGQAFVQDGAGLLQGDESFSF